MIYLAGPLFNQTQQDRIRKVATILRNKDNEVYVPMEHTVDNAYGLPNNVWAKAVFDEDIRALEECDTVVVCYDGLYSDSGTAWEAGYAYAKEKEIFVLCEETVIEASLMMLNGAYCSIGIKELEEYDFKKREKKLYRVSQT